MDILFERYGNFYETVNNPVEVTHYVRDYTGATLTTMTSDKRLTVGIPYWRIHTLAEELRAKGDTVRVVD